MKTKQQQQLSKMRLKLLKELLQERAGGVLANFARDLDRQPAYIWGLLNERRSIGEAICRHIEHKLKLVPGYLVNPQGMQTTDDGALIFATKGDTMAQKFHLAPLLNARAIGEALAKGVEKWESMIRAAPTRRCPTESSGRVIALRVEDETMEPCAMKGDEAFIDLEVIDPQDNAVLLAQCKSWPEPRLLLCMQAQGSYYLRTFSKAYNEVIKPVPVDRVKVLGRAIYVGRNISEQGCTRGEIEHHRAADMA